MRSVFPFSALVGQEPLKLALQMLAVDPRLGGVLIRGHKGTAKSTAARALAALLPAVEVNDGCPYGCWAARPALWCEPCRARTDHQVVRRPAGFETLPLGVTEDQLLGTLDLEHVLRHGERRFAPGILARVNQGVLYVDEVNLLDDHVVDLLLDVAASGVNEVARDGIAVSHPAAFMLVGTMNPEEGELRPQLLDRFGLCVEVTALSDPDQRAEAVMRRVEFDADPEQFARRWQPEQAALAEAITLARVRLLAMRPERRWCRAAAQLAVDLGVDGQRADLLLIKAALAAAALAGRDQIDQDDLERAASVVLPHRLARHRFAPGDGHDPQARAADLAERVRQALAPRHEKKNR